MKIGSRPIARIARTGELTPPGMTSTARRASSSERVSVSEAVTPSAQACSLPVGEVLGEVELSDLLELRRRVQRGALADTRLLGDRVEHRVALLLGAAMGHREDGVGPVLVCGALVAVRDAAHAGHARADLGDLLLGHLPNAHAVGGEARPPVLKDRCHAAHEATL